MKLCARSAFFKESVLFVVISLVAVNIDAMCPTTSPWTTPVQLTTTGIVVGDVVSAGNSAGFMATWADSSNNANYSFSSDGVTWQSGLIPPALANVGANIDVFVAGNATGFLVAWADGLGNGWSSFTADNGNTWSAAQQINTNSLSLDTSSSVYVAGGASGFVATMMVPGSPRDDLYVSFSTGTSAWTASPLQVTTDGSVFNVNGAYAQYVGAVIVGNSCMLAWIGNLDPTYSAFIDSIDPLSTTAPTIYPIVNVGQFLSNPIVAYLNGYYMAVSRANVSGGQTYFSVATQSSNWATFNPFASNPPDTGSGSWVAANQAGFMSTWSFNGNPSWIFTNNNGFNFTPLCSIPNTSLSSITGQVVVSANTRGFVATWPDPNDNNAYATFYITPTFTPPGSLFVGLLQQKYGPLL